jgi:autophagy-related protein 2
MNRVPWWKRSVRPDYVTLHLTDAKLHTSLDSRQSHVARHEIQCRQFLLTYTEADSDVPRHIGKASADECRSDESLQNEGEGFGWPRVVITLFPQHPGGPLMDDSSEGEPESSLDDTLENAPRHQPSPFSSKRIIHESDTPHSRPHNQNDSNKEGVEHR